jgi:hypothetical protein
MSTSTPVVAIPIVDTSNSMTSSNYVAITVIDTKAFLNCALEGDYIGVTSYDTSGRVSYNLTQVDQALSVPVAAANSVQNLNFTGSCTNMGSGLQTAVNMLSSSPSSVSKGFVLLSDGYQNCGTPPIPLPPGTPPVYSCAMGPNSDQNLMNQIATQSNGKYYYAPYVYDMMTIYNQIRAQTPQAQLLANGYKNAAPFDYLLIPATVSAGNDIGQFSVVWSDASIQFVNGQPGLNQISVTLVTPTGQTITPAPTLQGGGYVVFNIPNPEIGQWYIQIMYGGTQPQGLTGGAFEYAPSGNAAPIRMSVDAPVKVKAGSPINFSISLEDDGMAIANQQIRTVVTKPKISTSNALKTYSYLLKNVALPQHISDTIIGSPDVAKLEVLYRSYLPVTDLLPHIKYGTTLLQGKDGKYSGTINDTVEAGTYNLQLEVTGFSKKSSTPFSRNQLVSVFVED